MKITKYFWRKMIGFSLLITLTTLDMAIHPSTKYFKSIIALIPYIRSVFLISLFLFLLGALGLSINTRSDRELKLMFGRALYLPSIVGIAVVLITKGINLGIIQSPQFITSILIFLFGYFLSYTS